MEGMSLGKGLVDVRGGRENNRRRRREKERRGGGMSGECLCVVLIERLR